MRLVPANRDIGDVAARERELTRVSRQKASRLLMAGSARVVRGIWVR
jgi:hypothetical protein